MKIILATGIYPPDIGGPATYVRHLAEELTKAGCMVKVVTYGMNNEQFTINNVNVARISKRGGPLLRWWRYARALKKIAADADIVEAFSSVSVGVPLMLARLRRPKKILRLGGDFAWERYTDRGGMLGLREWYEAKPWSRFGISIIAKSFDHIIFSTRFQEEITECVYHLPPHSVLENAFPVGSPLLHESHRPLRLLFLGRFVGFKNLPMLVDAMVHLPGATLTFVGDGPMANRLHAQVLALGLQERILFLSPIASEERSKLFAAHDLLVIPSITEISPNTALEARAEGLPVLLSKHTGLSDALLSGIVIRDLRTSQEIADAVREIENDYENVAKGAASQIPARTWGNVAEEHMELFRKLVVGPREESRADDGGKRLLMISGDRSILQGKKSAFFYTLQELSKHWERIDIICPFSLTPDPSSILPSCLPGEGSPFENVFFHPSPHGLWYQPKWILRKGKELIDAFHHDVMTVHEYPPFYNGLGARWLHRVTGIPYALEIHHIVGFPAAASIAERIGRVLSRFVLPFTARRASAVRVVNTTTKATLSVWGIPEGKIQIVPSFYLDPALLAGAAPPNGYSFGEKIFDVSFCGRLVPNKNLPNLLRAIRDVPAAHLCVIGDGPERKRCEALAVSLGIADRITFAGWLPSAEKVIEALRSSRIFVMNSLSEGGPRVVLEAMAMGLPVIATPVGIIPEVIRDGVNGLLTDGSVADLAKKITLLLGDGAMRRRLGDEARKVLNQFDRTTLITRYAAFLKTLSAFPHPSPLPSGPTSTGRGGPLL